jgi:hypothetical protein
MLSVSQRRNKEMADKPNTPEKKTRRFTNNAQRFSSSTVINFIAMLTLFIFIFALHQIAGDSKVDNVTNDGGVISAAPPPENTKKDASAMSQKEIPAGIDLASILMPTSPAPVAKIAVKPTVKPAPKKVMTAPSPEQPRLDKARTKKRARLVQKRRRRKSVREIERQVPVEALDGESARLSYLSQNGGSAPIGEMRGLPHAEDLDGASARRRYISENNRLANSDLTQNTPSRSQNK